MPVTELFRVVHSSSCPDCGSTADHRDGCVRGDTCGQCVIGEDGWVPTDELHADSEYVTEEGGAWTISEWWDHLQQKHSKGS